MMLEAPQVLLIRLVRRAAEKGREVSDRCDVSSLRASRETADLHVLDHALAQWADGFVSHRSAPCVEVKVLETPNLNTGQTRPVNPQIVPPVVSNYRVAVSFRGYERS
jgi:hypothetical protein